MPENYPDLAPEQEATRRRRALSSQLFEVARDGTWVVLDGARVPKLVRKLDSLQVEYVCLLPGHLEPSMARVAPYLARLEPDDELTDWILGRGWGRSWGVFVPSSQDTATLRNHLRRFLEVKRPDGKVVRFRYYDPRVLRVYLPTCEGVELDYLFGESDLVTAFAMESEDASSLHRFQRSGSSVVEELMPC